MGSRQSDVTGCVYCLRWISSPASIPNNRKLFFKRRPAADPRRRGFRQDARHRAPHRPPRQQRRSPSPTRSSPSPSPTRRPRRCGRASRRCSRRRRLPVRDVDLDVPRAVRPAAAPRGAAHRPVARLRHLRLDRSADGRQAGAQAARHRRQRDAAARGAVAHQPREEPDGRPGGLHRERVEPARCSRSASSTRCIRRR